MLEQNPPSAASRDRDLESPVALAAFQVVRAALDPEVTVTRLGELAARDPAFALRVLAVASSAAYALPRLSDVRQAAGLLGIRGLRNIALGLALTDMAPAGEDGEVLLVNSLRRAVVARAIAEQLRLPELDSYFTAGLFLEIGLLTQARSDVRAAGEVARLPAAQRVTVERAMGLEDHAGRGARTAAGYGLEERLVQAVREHHAEQPHADPLGRVCWAAERVAAIWEGGNPLALLHEASAALRHIGAEDVDAIVAVVPERVTAAALAFQRDVPRQETVEALTADAAKTLVDLNHSYEALVRRLERLVAEKEQLMQELSAANRQLTELASTDALTGLANKRALQNELARELARSERSGECMSLVLLDVDFFKKVNDEHGHLVGDEVLRWVSGLLMESVRAGDLVARYGGEEFVLLLPATTAEGARTVAERARTMLEHTPMQLERVVLRLTASFGVASVSGAEARGAGEALLAAADRALYEAKRSGRNRTAVAAASPPELERAAGA